MGSSSLSTTAAASSWSDCWANKSSFPGISSISNSLNSPFLAVSPQIPHSNALRELGEVASIKLDIQSLLHVSLILGGNSELSIVTFLNFLSNFLLKIK